MTGLFYHEVMAKEHDPLAMSVGEGFSALAEEGLLEREWLRFFEAKPAGEDLVLRVHDKGWVERLKGGRYWDVSLYSAGALVMAFEKVLSGEVDNALSLSGAGGHHAHRDYAWGGCYINHSAIAITWAREAGMGRRFAIVDTDTHHGDGTREIFLDDEDVLHICYCGQRARERNTKICFPHANGDDEFVRRLSGETVPLLEDFKPDLILWVCGLDTHRDSYGTRRLTEECYPRLLEILKGASERISRGRIIVRTACNAPSHVSRYVLPRLLKILGRMRRVKIRAGSVEALGELLFSRTADIIWDSLPIEGVVRRRGDEIYFETPLAIEEEGRDIVRKGELGYRRSDKAFCIFFGSAPVRGEVRAAGSVNIFGRLLADPEILKGVKDGEKIRVERLSVQP